APLPAAAYQKNSANPPIRRPAADPGSAAGSEQKATSRGPFAPRSAVVFRSAVLRWRAACRSPSPRPLFANPPLGRTVLAPGSPVTATPPHSPPLATSRCIVKPPARSLALV